MLLGITMTNPQRFLKDISKLDYFKEYPRHTWTGCSERSFGSAIDIGDGQFVVPLDTFSLVVIDTSNYSFTSESTILVELMKTPFRSAGWVASIENEGRNWKS